jgi:hypothetical protein
MGDAASVVTIELAPIEGKIFFILPQADVNELTANVLAGGEEKETFAGAKLKSGFYHFLYSKFSRHLIILKFLKTFRSISFLLQIFLKKWGFVSTCHANSLLKLYEHV